MQDIIRIFFAQFKLTEKFDRARLEKASEQLFKGRFITYTPVFKEPITGMVQTVAVWIIDQEPNIILSIGQTRIEVEFVYFINHVIIHDVDSDNTNAGSPNGAHEGD